MRDAAGRTKRMAAAQTGLSGVGCGILSDKWAHGLDLLKERVDRFSPQQ